MLLVVATAAIAPFASQLAAAPARLLPVAMYDVEVIALQLAAPTGGFAIASLALLISVPCFAARWLLAGDPPREILWLKNWPDGYRAFGFLDLPEFDFENDPVMRVFREIGEEEINRPRGDSLTHLYVPPLAPSPSDLPARLRGSLAATAPAQVAAPLFFDEGNMPAMVPTSSASN